MAKSAIKSPLVSAAAVQAPVENRPVHVIHHGYVRGSIRRSESKRGMTHTVTCDRVWRDSAHQEHVSSTFESGDLRMLVKVAGECLQWIEWQEKMRASGGPRAG
jgi:hypothetical protein